MVVRPRKHDYVHPTTGRGEHHGLPVVNDSCLVTLSRSLNATFWCMSGPRALPVLGHFGPILLSSLIL